MAVAATMQSQSGDQPDHTEATRGIVRQRDSAAEYPVHRRRCAGRCRHELPRREKADEVGKGVQQEHDGE
jgi:hypothetical protein